MVAIAEDEAGQRIDNFLRTQLKGVPKSMIYRILRKGEVRVNKKRVKPEYKLDLDIAVCKVAENKIGGSYQPLNVGQHALKIGDRAVAIGYAEMKNIQFGELAAYQPSLID